VRSGDPRLWCTEPEGPYDAASMNLLVGWCREPANSTTQGHDPCLAMGQIRATLKLLAKTKTMVERVICCDLKGAVELGQYQKSHPDRVKVVHDVAGVMTVVVELVKLLDFRLNVMRQRGRKAWRGPRIFFVVDEFAIIEQYKVKKSDKAGEEARGRNVA
jgi:hypothetical protein